MLRIAEYRNVLGEDGKSIRREKIDLKELEKFGFKQSRYYYKKEIGNHEIYNIKIDNKKIIHFNQLSVHNELPIIMSYQTLYTT